MLKVNSKSIDWTEKTMYDRWSQLYPRRMASHYHHERSELLKEIKRNKSIG